MTGRGFLVDAYLYCWSKTLAAYPPGRLGEPEDIAGAAVFLASRAGTLITGQTLVVDGGTSASGGQYS